MTTPASPVRYAVIGNPVAHSRSPWIHAAFAKQTGHTLQYDKLLVPLDGFARCVNEFAASGTLPAHGCNVTVPFKTEAFALAPRCTERALLAGSANTLRFDAEGWLADNTDGTGLVRDIEENVGVALEGLRVLIIGAGGAAAGAIGPLLRSHPEELVIANRTLDKAQALADQHQAVKGATQLYAHSLDRCGERFDVVINATTSSLQGASLPVSLKVFKPGGLALDMMYGPSAQPFLAAASQEGARGRDGLGMLVEQAAEAFYFWRGVRPLTRPILTQLRQGMKDGTH